MAVMTPCYAYFLRGPGFRANKTFLLEHMNNSSYVQVIKRDLIIYLGKKIKTGQNHDNHNKKYYS